MTFRRNVFTSQKLILRIAGKELRVQALVSAVGAKYVFEESEIPAELAPHLKDEIEAVYKNIPVACRLVKETTGMGIFYHLRFIGPSRVLQRQIDRDLKESGLPSPWLRAMPRLSTQTKHLPSPALAVLYHQNSTIFLNVKNFTLGGLLVDYVGDKLDDLKLGSRLEFDLVTNTGEKIPDLVAVVTNISAEPEASGLSRFYFGLKLMPMTLLSESKYKGLIRDHCLGLKTEAALF